MASKETTGDLLVIVSDRSPARFARIASFLLTKYPVVRLSARGRHVSALFDVLRMLKGSVDIVGSKVFFADHAAQIEVAIRRCNGGSEG